MQYLALVSEAKHPDRFDCTSGHELHPQCLLRGDDVKIEILDYDGNGRQKRKLKSVQDIEDYLCYCKKFNPDTDDINFLLRVANANVCPNIYITNLSRELYNMVKICDGVQFPYAGDYGDQLEIYIDAMAIISQTENTIKKRKEKVKKK